MFAQKRREEYAAFMSARGLPTGHRDAVAAQ